MGRELEKFGVGSLKLQVITNRGEKVYPGGFPETFTTDHWRCRFHGIQRETFQLGQVAELYTKLAASGFDCIKTENLYSFDGEPGFSAVHG